MRLIMTFIFLWVSIAALGACTAITTNQAPTLVPTNSAELVCPSSFCSKPVFTPEEIAGCAPQTSRNGEDFKKLTIGMSFKQVCAQVGLPDWDAGSGLFIPVYDLPDGSRFLIGFSGPDKMLYIQQMPAK